MMYFNIHAHSVPRELPYQTTTLYNVMVGKDSIPGEESGQLLTCGIHPWYIRSEALEEQLSQFREWAEKENVVMIGEAGLDKLIVVPLSLQMQLLEEQIYYSEKLRKPLLIHCVKAWTELIALKKRMKPDMPWIIHGFRGNSILAQQLIDQDFYLSFGICFNPASVQVAWPDRIFVETDDQSVDIRTVYQLLSETLVIDEQLFAAQQQRNWGLLLLNK